MKPPAVRPGPVGRLEENENMAIGSVIQRSGSLVIYDERGHQRGMVLTASGDCELQGYTIRRQCPPREPRAGHGTTSMGSNLDRFWSDKVGCAAPRRSKARKSTMPEWPHFEHEISALKLFDLIEWAHRSEAILAGGPNPNNSPVLAMPPMQRSAVWRPKQVLDLWDSMMRGLPIGMCYIVERRGGDRKVVLLNGETREIDYAGFDLLDGQQRLRALLVGAGHLPEEQRCLWADLGDPEALQFPCLRISSRAQPFGYDKKSGSKLRLDERRRAREQLEDGCELYIIDDERKRPAYDHELFDGEVFRSHRRIVQPPAALRILQKMFQTSPASFSLAELVKVGRNFGARSATEIGE